jgi:ketosteroid isomerase-like protein
MSRENVELYLRAIQAWNDGDENAFVALVSDDWEFRTTGTFPGFDPVYRGREGARRFYETLREPWESFVIEVARTIDAGDRVVGLLRFNGRGRGSGAEVSLEYAHVATYVAGEGTMLAGYTSHVEALEAAGLPE